MDLYQVVTPHTSTQLECREEDSSYVPWQSEMRDHFMIIAWDEIYVAVLQRRRWGLSLLKKLLEVIVLCYRTLCANDRAPFQLQ